MTGTVPCAVSISGVSKVFNAGKPNEVRALEDIDLAIDEGTFVSLIGPSGCGKSTLLRLIGALTHPTAGEVCVNDKSADRARLDRDYGMAFQTSGLFKWRSVTENIELPLQLMGWSKQERKGRAAEMLDLVKLGEFADHYPREMSGGMRQRVAIARALSFRPSLLLMDEPFGALDEMTREHMQTEVLDIWKKTEKTIVFVTHSIPEAVFLSERVIVMSPRPGRIAADIPVDLGERVFETREAPEFFERITEVREALRFEGNAG
ncbi:MAG: ATP-binding cassette domain-containing protein [Proteobacteria bacterium]|nr:ATP-binding cassette domain-containing protein [Pseudomonadota bacterium]